METKNNIFIYSAKIGAFGEVTFWKDPETNTYSFTFFNGEQYTPLQISESAAYYVWAFIGCEHPDCNSISTFTPIKKAGRSNKPKKRPSLTSKKKAKSK